MKTNTSGGLVKMSWNTGRSYMADGQRMAAQRVGGDVLMVDIDRGIEYWLPNCELDRSVIMARYDANDRTQGIPANQQYREIVRELKQYAKTAGSAVNTR